MKIEPGDVLATGRGVGVSTLRLVFADRGKRYDYVLIGYYNPDRDGYEFWDKLEDYMTATADEVRLTHLDKVKFKIPPDLKWKIVQGLFLKGNDGRIITN